MRSNRNLYQGVDGGREESYFLFLRLLNVLTHLVEWTESMY